MKNRILYMLVVLVVLLCTACQNSEPEQGRTIDMRDEISQALSESTYENIEILFDEIQYYSGQNLNVFNVEIYDLYSEYSYQELAEFYCQEVFPELLDVNEIDKSLLFDADSRISIDENGISVYEKTYDDVLSSLGEYEQAPHLVYKDSENWASVSYMVDWIGGVKISQGILGEYANSYTAYGAWDAIEREKTYDCHIDDLSDSYMLMDGEKTVAEAKAEMEAYLDAHYPIGDRDNGIKNEILSISVGKIVGTEYYGFTAERTLTYEGIPFREMPNNNHEPAGEAVIMGECAMCESNKLDITIGIINMYATPEKVRTITEVIPFTEVMERVSYYLTGETKFQLLYGGLEYRLMKEGNSIQCVQMVPYWTFIAKNPNDDTMIKMYVDLETGEITHTAY